MFIIDSLLNTIGTILDKAIPDANVREQVRLELEKAAQKAREMEAADRISARQREVGLAAAGFKDKVPQRLAYLAVGGFFTVLAGQFYLAIGGILIDASIQRTLDITLGVLFAMVLAVKDYYFGSSDGGDRIIQIVAKNGKGDH
jgi:hypothetical protein